MVLFQKDVLAKAKTRLADLLARMQVDPDPDYHHIVTNQRKVLARYRPQFQPDRIMFLEKDEFLSFLRYDNNCHWDSLPRIGPRITSDYEHLKGALTFLVDESRPIQERLTYIRPLYHSKVNAVIPFLGMPVLTAVLLVAYPLKYGVWNSTSMEGMRQVGLWDDRWEKSACGLSYTYINNIYQELTEIGIDLWTLDALWWVIKKEANPEG